MDHVVPVLNTGSKFSVSLCVLNQWALDFAGNTKRILQSIVLSKKAGARYRLGPELELSSYGCEDHFHELDTYDHSWQCLAEILKQTIINPDMQDIVCDVGMPVLFSGVAYNCRVILLNGRILLIRPKLVLADGGLHRETRWFTAWPHQMRVVNYPLPAIVRHASLNGDQVSAPFGDALLYFTGSETLADVTVGLETCEELWIGCPPHLQMYASGADVVLNASASHHELRKLGRRIELVEMASRSSGGGLYAYTNLRGCDSERICYDGGALAAVCGRLIYLGKQFSLDEVEVNVVTTELDAIRSRRINNKSFGRAAAAATALHRLNDSGTSGYPVIRVEFSLCHKLDGIGTRNACANSIYPKLQPEEEIAQGPALWLWDVLRKSGSAGFFLCLSGGLDSASVACLILSLCHQVCNAIQAGNAYVIQTATRILGIPESEIRRLTSRDICSRIFFTCYMPSVNSSEETKSRAKLLAESIGSQHLNASIDATVNSLIGTATSSLGLSRAPRFTVEGGEVRESLALQNVQARSRLVLSYLMAQLIPQQHRLTGSLLMLSSGNLDECLRGYLTKYDCSSADVNPIGSISKRDLRGFIKFCAESLSNCLISPYNTQFKKTLQRIACAQPTAELMPLDSTGTTQQNDEADMGLTYNMLSLFGRLRKVESCGPYSTLRRLLDGAWIEIRDDIPSDCFCPNGEANKRLATFLSNKVKWFFRTYAINRHKTTVLPPAYHTEAYNADDNRFDLRPFLYPADWTHQFSCMDVLVQQWAAEKPDA